MTTSQKIKDLRSKTGAGMMDCKNALNETNNNIEAAEDWLRKKGISTAQKKSVRDASEGLVTISIKNNAAMIVEINSETDFVARNKDFQYFCKRITDTFLKKEISDINSVNEVIFDDSSLKLEDELTAMVSKVGENLVIKRLKFIKEDNNFVQKYIHNSENEDSGKIGVILSYRCIENGNEERNVAKNLCMHIAACDPKSLTPECLDESLINREKAILQEQMVNSGKPQEIVQKIITGRINKFFDEVCLMEQSFVMDNKFKIKDYINDVNKQTNNNFEIKSFTFFKVGENL